MVAAACGATGRTFDWHLGDKAAVDTVFARTTKKKLNSIKLSFQHPFIWECWFRNEHHRQKAAREPYRNSKGLMNYYNSSQIHFPRKLEPV
jgi:hypothetical protein